MAENTITQTAALPHGYRATFHWSKAGGLKVEWEPSVPSIQSPRHRRKFLEAYQGARREFMADVATTIGGSVMVVDMTGETEVVRPGTRH